MTWLTRLLWLSLPFTLGDLLADAVADRSAAVAWVVAVGSWAIWLAALAASLVALPATLVVLRVLAPCAPVAAVVAATQSTPSALGWIGVLCATAAAVLASMAEVGDEYLNAVAYGDERRFALRAPAVLLFGPVPLLWSAMCVVPAVGLLLLAAEQWVLGVVAVVLGSVAIWLGTISLAKLTRRWLVFVPAGVTLVDHLAIVEPTLMRRTEIRAIGPAPADTDALDLSVGATGLILQIDLGTPHRFTPVAPRHRVSEAVEATSVLVAVPRPGALLAHAARHHVRVAGAADDR